MGSLHESLRKTDRVLRIYREKELEKEGRLALPIQIDPLAQIVKDDTGLGIECRKLNLDQPGQIRGRLLRYKDIAYIEYNSELNTCWTRFVVCKELCHLILDSEEEYTKSLPSLVEQLIGQSTGEPKEDLASERMAEIAALELLFPHDFRRSFIEHFENGRLSLLKIATILRIPQKYAEVCLHRRYVEYMADIRGKMATASG